MSGPSLVEEIFLAAVEKRTPEERAALLDVACRGDAELRLRVERLLEAHPRIGSFLEHADGLSGEHTAPYLSGGDSVGTVIARRYKLLEQIGEGGMGTVWVAEQIEPVRRKVALKLIKAGMDSKSVLARFEAERQALALMDHPHIAKVLDGGATEQGRPFFVMEYVKGVPLTQYCDDARLTVEERLELFISVCQAVQHAHQKGIIHRDLKPSNVLVCLYDGKPLAKVIDFGLAKAMHQPLTEHTLHTAHGVMIGTPLYMSPEQAEFNNLDVDTRTDIYSLGVILYELLTGTTPLEKQQLKDAAWQEMLRLIKEEIPPRPSTRLSSTATSPSIAAQRQMEPVKLSRLLNGELDWIVMKALEKERSRRYETATGFAADVRRFLSREPVSAVPPSAGYRVRKFLRKHRRPVAMALILFLALVAGVIGTTLGLVEARRQRDAARQAEAVADEHRRDIERTAASLQVDLDLAAMQEDSRLGLLRLARTLKDLPAELTELREFAAVAVLAVGQSYAPLLPPITRDGHEVVDHEVSPDGRTLLTRGTDFSARLWDMRTARQIAVLRRDGERVINCAFSPDGRTAVTDTVDGILRFWDVPNGTFRAQAEPRADPFSQETLSDFDQHYDDPGFRRSSGFEDTLHVAANRVLTKRDATTPDVSSLMAGPVELWDSTTGRRIARLDRPGMDVDDFQFTPDGHWVTTIEGRDTVIVFSADDGREIARLTHQNLSPEESVSRVMSATRGLLTTVVFREDSSTAHLHVWETGSWREVPSAIPLWSPDRAGKVEDVDDEHFAVFVGNEWLIYRHGATQPLHHVKGASFESLAGEIVHSGDGQLFNVWTGRRLLPPAGRRYHPELARFAPDGRFIGLSTDFFWSVALQIVDTRTDKTLDVAGYDWSSELSVLPGFGQGAVAENWGDATILLIPTTPPQVPPDKLELWAQVAVRGEIGPEGSFVKWDEPTWERKRQELAAVPAPSPDFPFPGHVVTDRLHWLRSEFEDSWSPADRLRLAQQLLERAEATGERSEIARWRREWESRNSTAPSDRPE